MLQFLGRVPFWLRTLIGFAAGIAVALVYGEEALPWLNPVGDIFVRAIKMIVVPLVFFTIAASLARLGREGTADGGRVVRLGVYTILWFVITAVISVSVGLALAHYFQPGQGITGLAATVVAPKPIPAFTEVLVGIVPTNVFQSFAEGKVLSVVLFAVLCGAALGALGHRTSALGEIVEQGSAVMFRITRWIIQLTPIGVFGLIGTVVASYGLESLTPLLGFIGCIYLGCGVILFVVYPLLLKVHGLKVTQFYANAFVAQQTAFFTCSSIGTLPVSLSVAVEKLKLSAGYAGFALPLGANMKMDGCGGIYPAVSAVFIANYFGLELTTSHYVIIAVTAVLGSLATAGVPGVATIMLTLTLSSVGLPLEGIALLAAIDRILDMVRTATNVTGQIVVPTLVARANGLIDAQSPVLPSIKPTG